MTTKASQAMELAERIENLLQRYPCEVAWSDSLRRSQWAMIVSALRTQGNAADEIKRLRADLATYSTKIEGEENRIIDAEFAAQELQTENELLRTQGTAGVPEGFKLVPISRSVERRMASASPPPQAGEGPGLSTLAADVRTSPSASPRGGPAPVTISPREEWRTIDSAPKDGTKVDLWCRSPGISGGGPARIPECWYSVGKWWRYDETEFADENCRSRVHNATHWMPLPEPPSIPHPPQSDGGSIPKVK